MPQTLTSGAQPTPATPESVVSSRLHHEIRTLKAKLQQKEQDAIEADEAYRADITNLMRFVEEYATDAIEVEKVRKDLITRQSERIKSLEAQLSLAKKNSNLPKDVPRSLIETMKRNNAFQEEEIQCLLEEKDALRKTHDMLAEEMSRPRPGGFKEIFGATTQMTEGLSYVLDHSQKQILRQGQARGGGEEEEGQSDIKHLPHNHLPQKKCPPVQSTDAVDTWDMDYVRPTNLMD